MPRVRQLFPPSLMRRVWLRSACTTRRENPTTKASPQRSSKGTPLGAKVPFGSHHLVSSDASCDGFCSQVDKTTSHYDREKLQEGAAGETSS